MENRHTGGEEPLYALTTEQVNPLTKDIDTMTTADMVAAINALDAEVHIAVRRELPRIAQAVDRIADALKNGGRLFYIGAGTSGRLGVLDASECPPTYGVAEGLVTGIIAGGDYALRHTAEGVEDDRQEGIAEVRRRGLSAADVLVGLTASGRAPYVLGAMEEARRRGAGAVGVCCAKGSRLAECSDICIAAVTGPEAVMGSTRMKAGTAQKMILNMLSTAAMIKLGKVYGNLMVDMQPKNSKLRDRAVRIVMLAGMCTRERAAACLEETGYHSKPAVVMALTGCGADEARRRLDQNGGFVRACLD